VDRFSKRHGYKIPEKEITMREDAPIGLRDFVIQTVYGFNYKPSFLRRIICKVLRRSPDQNNWTEYPNIEGEVQELIQGCEWFHVYDIIEALWQSVDFQHKEVFADDINDYFKSNGLGWKIEYGIVETRGDEIFEKAISQVAEVLKKANRQTAKSEMEEALNDLSRRPHPDLTGAIQHSLACLECICREVTGDKKATLGELMKKFPDVVPKPLDSAIEKIWGFASGQGRHLREGEKPQYLEVELVVELTAALVTYLGKKY